MSRFALTRSFWNLLAPLSCAVCQTLLPEHETWAICGKCRPLVESPLPRCRFCAAPLAGKHSIERCNHCYGEKFRFDRIVSLGAYHGALMQAVTHVKSTGNDRLARLLGDMLAHRCGEVLAEDPPQAVVATPMALRHRLLRGTNVPDLLAIRIGRQFHAPALLDALRWQRIPLRQSSLAPSFRRKNVRKALAASASYDFEGCHVLVVDDVVTTAATADEATRALLAAGASRVSIASAARGLGE